jgi:hypothetical protein
MQERFGEVHGTAFRETAMNGLLRSIGAHGVHYQHNQP